MVTLLEFIFQGFFEWVYGLILEIWNYFSSSLLNVMSLDFAYLKSHIPVMGDIQQVILAVGWALLLGNLVFQALRSMVSGLGFEGEDPKLLFARTFVFGFLLLASPQICETVLGITSSVIALLEVPDAINVQLVDGSVIGVFTASWILVIIFDLITMFMVLSLLLEVAERYMVLAMLTVMAPLAFAMGGSKSTSEIFAGWCRMFGSMCFLMATNIVFFKMLLSVVSTVPSFPDVFLWMVLIISIVKVAKKADEIITRIGLNPAITGNRSSLPGVIAYTVFRTALSMVTKGAAKGVGGALGLTGKAAAGIGKGAGIGIGKGAAGRAFKGAGKGFGAAAGAVAGGIGGAAAQAAGGPRYGGGRTQASKTDSQQEHNQRTQQDTSQIQTDSQRQTTAQERTTGSQGRGPGSAFQSDRPSRKTSVQPGTHRAPSYVKPSDGQATEKSASHTESSGRPTGFTGFHGPQDGGFTGRAPRRGEGFTEKRGGGFSSGRGGGFSKDTARGGGFSSGPRGGGFTGASPGRGGGFTKETARGSGFGGTGAKADTPRGGGTFGGQPSGTTKRNGFGGSFRSGGFGGAGAKPDTPRGGGTFGGQPSGTTQRNGFGGSSHSGGFGGMRTKTDTPRGGGTFGGRPSGTTQSTGFDGSFRSGGFGGAGAKPDTPRGGGTFGGQASSTPRSSGFGRRGDSEITTARTFGDHSKGFGGTSSKTSEKAGTPHPGTAGTAPGSRKPPGQKLSGGPSKQKPTRQTKREEGPTSV